MDSSNKKGAYILVCCILIGSLTLAYFTEKSEASSFSIIDYDYEGIAADTTQYFVIWNQGINPVELTVNASVLEFVGSTGWPQFEMRVFRFSNYNYTADSLAICGNLDNYTCKLSFNALNNSRYTLAVTNVDPMDDAVYNLTISSPSDLDFQYTTMYEINEVSNPLDNTVTITYFESTNPFLYRLESAGTSRVVVSYVPFSTTDEMYFFIFNKGETCDLFVGLLGLPYLSDFPSLTAFVIDFEEYGQENGEILYLWTISNFSCGNTFRCESGHRYNFWIDLGYYRPDLYVVFDSLGRGNLNFDSDLLTPNPEGEISIRLSFTDPYVEFRQLQRDAWNLYLGVGAGIGGVTIFSIWYLRRRYY